MSDPARRHPRPARILRCSLAPAARPSDNHWPSPTNHVISVHSPTSPALFAQGACACALSRGTRKNIIVISYTDMSMATTYGERQSETPTSTFRCLMIITISIIFIRPRGGRATSAGCTVPLPRANRMFVAFVTFFNNVIQ